MAPTLADQDRLIVNKLAYRLGEPRRGDIVMLYYPLNPDKSFVKRVIAEEGDEVRIVDGRVYRQRRAAARRLRPDRVSQPRRLGTAGHPGRLLLRHGRPSQQQLGQPHWGMVPKKYIIGKVQLRWWPIPSAHGLLSGILRPVPRPRRTPRPRLLTLPLSRASLLRNDGRAPTSQRSLPRRVALSSFTSCS